jgi:hypothetical protein
MNPDPTIPIRTASAPERTGAAAVDWSSEVRTRAEIRSIDLILRQDWKIDRLTSLTDRSADRTMTAPASVHTVPAWSFSASSAAVTCSSGPTPRVSGL